MPATTIEAAVEETNQSPATESISPAPPGQAKQNCQGVEMPAARETGPVPTQAAAVRSPALGFANTICLPDGSLIELVRSDGKLKLLRWKEGTATITDRFEHEGTLLAPPEIPEPMRHLRLPPDVQPCPSADELFVKLRERIARFVELPPHLLTGAQLQRLRTKI